MDKQTFFRSPLSSTGLHSTEIEANKFAAELLMPKKFLLTALSEYEDLLDNEEDVVDRLASEFHVSSTAMSIRLSTLLQELGVNSF